MPLPFHLDPEGIFATLADLVSINSVNSDYPGGPGEAAVAAYVSDFFEKNSIPFTIQPVLPNRANVIAKLEGRPGNATLVLEAHMDTASERGMSVDPFQPVRKGSRMYGRGTCDTKGGLAAMMHTLKALADSRLRPSNSVILVATVDEEYSYRGITKFTETGTKADGAIVAEPTDLETVVASKGALRWRFRARGRAAHSSKPHLGVNAIAKMAKLIVAMEERFPPIFRERHHPLLGSPTINIGIIEGGIQVNQVPDYCSIQVDRRLLPNETADQVRSECERLISDLRAGDSAFEIETDQLLEDFALETSAAEPIVQVATKVTQHVIGRSRLIGVPYGSDASKLARVGIPSIILGPGSIDQAHSADEYVDLNQVALAAEIYLGIVTEF